MQTAIPPLSAARVLTALIIVALFGACKDDHGVTAPSTASDTLLVIHTNDHHGAIFPSNNLGGLSRRAAFINTLKTENKNVLILDAGDMNIGGALSNMFDAEPDILAYNMIGYDAVTLGNHEFSKPFETLRRQMELADFKFLSANVKTSGGGYLADPYIVKDFGGLRAAVIGLTTTSTSGLSVAQNRFVLENEITAAREIVRKVRETENPALMILLAHVGDVPDGPYGMTSAMLADSVADIDLIIDGHSHTRMTAPVFRNGVPIVSAFEWGKEVGAATFTFTNGQVTNFEWTITPINESIPSNSAMDALIRPFADSMQAAMSDNIAVAAGDFVFLGQFGDDTSKVHLTRYHETAIGNLICDAVMHSVSSLGHRADFALLNGGGFRAGLNRGSITKADIFAILPFDNVIEIVELSGAQVAELFDFVAAIQQGEGGFAQLSKEARYKLDPTALTSSNVTINGAPVDPSKNYFVATNDYLAGGGNGYAVFTRGLSYFKAQKQLADAAIEYLQSRPAPIEPVLDGRITIQINDGE